MSVRTSLLAALGACILIIGAVWSRSRTPASPEIESGWVEGVEITANGEPLGETMSLSEPVLFDVGLTPHPSHQTKDWIIDILFGQEPFERAGPGSPSLGGQRWYARGDGPPLEYHSVRKGKKWTLPKHAPADGKLHVVASKSSSQKKHWSDRFPAALGKWTLEIAIYPTPGPEDPKTFTRDYGPCHLVYRRTIDVVEVKNP